MIRDYKVHQPHNNKPYVLEIDGKGEFHKGISGSPLLVLTPNGRVFVAGIVTEVKKNPNLTEQEDKLSICNVSLINEVLSDITYNLRALSGEKKEFYDCKNIKYPYPEPLLINYCIYLKKINMEKDFFERERGIKLSEKDMNIISGCLVENETWDSTRTVLNFANRYAKIATEVGEMLNRKKKEFDNTVATAKPDTDIAQVLDKNPLTKKEDELFAELIREINRYQSEPKSKLVKNIPTVIIPSNGSWGLEQASTIIENDKTSLQNQAWIQKSEFVKQELIKSPGYLKSPSLTPVKDDLKIHSTNPPLSLPSPGGRDRGRGLE